MKNLLAVDEYGPIAGCQPAENVLECRGAAHRVAVKVARIDILAIGLIPVSGLL